MKVGNLVRWSPTNSCPMMGLVLSYCSFQQLWHVWFPNDGRYEIEEHYLEVISENQKQPKTLEVISESR